MINLEKRFKFKNRNVFIEADFREDVSRPLEWRRSINSIDIEAKCLVIKEHHTVNELDYAARGLLRTGLRAADDNSDAHTEKEYIKPKPGLRRVISSRISLDDIRDSIYRTVDEDQDEKIFSLARAKDYIDLSITDDDPLEEAGAIFAAGVHNGHVWFEDDEERLTIHVSVDKDVLEHLVTEIKNEKVAELSLRIAIDSFSYEVDDFVRRWYYPRDLVIEGSMAHAALESFSIVSNAYGQQPLIEPPTEPDDETDEAEPQTQIHQPQINNIIDITQLRSIKIALWMIAVVLAAIWIRGK